MSNVRNLSISLEVAKEWYQQGGDLKSIALQVFKEYELHYLPKTWEEFCQLTNTPDIQSVGVPTEIIALMKLVKLRDYYCKGCENPCIAIVNAIEYVCDEDGTDEKLEYFSTREYEEETRVLSFPSYSIADEFIINFKDLLVVAKKYI